jgi:hypothetical protein
VLPATFGIRNAGKNTSPAFGAQIYFGIQWVSDENGGAAGGVPWQFYEMNGGQDDIFVCVNTSKRVGDAEHANVYANADAAEK